MLSRVNDTAWAQASINDSPVVFDPLTQLACIFSAFIHDVDHPGVSNAQLLAENDPLATSYNGKSMAEQNSVDIAWAVFMEDRFTEFRQSICSTESEMARFRQIVVNSVIATDVFDKDLTLFRSKRWDLAFSEQSVSVLEEYTNASRNRKATIVLEHLIQASDVAHTMQHWHVYRYWNGRLFEEIRQAYQEGRAKTDPTEYWYASELGFFDHYVIPLAKKLHDCRMFGVSSDEYLNYAVNNREEWKRKGKDIVAHMMQKSTRKLIIPRDVKEPDIPRDVEEPDIPRDVEEPDIPRDVEEPDIPRVVEEPDIPRVVEEPDMEKDDISI